MKGGADVITVPYPSIGHPLPPSDTLNFLLISFTIAPKLGTQYLVTFLNLSQLFFNGNSVVSLKTRIGCLSRSVDCLSGRSLSTFQK